MPQQGLRPQYAACVFDMDGVLLDSEPLNREVAARVLQEAGLEVAPDDLRRFTGFGHRAMFAQIQQETGLPYGPDWCLARFAELLPAALGRLQAIPGALETVARLASAGVPVAVATSTPGALAQLLLRAGGFWPHLAALAAGDEVAQAKPAPDLYLLAARRLGRTSAECLAVEDSAVGVVAARRAGLDVLHFLGGGASCHPEAVPLPEMAAFPLDRFGTAAGEPGP